VVQFTDVVRVWRFHLTNFLSLLYSVFTVQCVSVLYMQFDRQLPLIIRDAAVMIGILV